MKIMIPQSRQGICPLKFCFDGGTCKPATTIGLRKRPPGIRAGIVVSNYPFHIVKLNSILINHKKGTIFINIRNTIPIYYM